MGLHGASFSAGPQPLPYPGGRARPARPSQSSSRVHLMRLSNDLMHFLAALIKLNQALMRLSPSGLFLLDELSRDAHLRSRGGPWAGEAADGMLSRREWQRLRGAVLQVTTGLQACRLRGRGCQAGETSPTGPSAPHPVGPWWPEEGWRQAGCSGPGFPAAQWG